ncbi:TetR/AcrR family transcriptional regulator [Crossiella cryophila]|uniref:AcrR family transcriptional regulator n=1 Tax=Crossiella cryophila TaxID=43355 RepID=A0A7W7FSW5_9PSEU|nr:TetR family transcriptional regulator C-terminal domain-containing protein [Crossiella cryophila]MBB4676400.1 AcrR family transcriptional regulator [Crossiella cryophila]
MPKLVDHEARRRELAQAVWRVVQRDGVERASVRAVAAESGWSAGALRHYFPTQDALLHFAMDLAAEKFTERARALDEHGVPPQEHSAPWRVRRLLTTLLPLDADSKVSAEVWMAFVTRARVDPVLRAAGRKGDELIAEWLLDRLRDAAEEGILRTGADPVREALRLLALTDGLALHGLITPEAMPPELMVQLLEDHLREVFPGRDLST